MKLMKLVQFNAAAFIRLNIESTHVKLCIFRVLISAPRLIASRSKPFGKTLAGRFLFGICPVFSLISPRIARTFSRRFDSFR